MKTIRLPTEDEWPRLNQAAYAFKWEVVSSTTRTPIIFRGLQHLSRAIVSGELDQTDTCKVHKFAPSTSLREACDQHSVLRKLYNPERVFCRRASLVLGITFAVAYLVAAIITGLTTMGGTFLAYLLFGILGVVLTPTIIGLFVLYVIAVACGMSVGLLIGACLGVALGALIAGASFLVGCGVGYVAGLTLAKLLGLQRKRAVCWD